jgi:hypothetical protein
LIERIPFLHFIKSDALRAAKSAPDNSLSVHADPLVTERWRLTFCRLLGSPRLKDGIDASQPANRSTVRSWSARPAHCERPHGVADDR